jgi:hypothetical protein
MLLGFTALAIAFTWPVGELWRPVLVHHHDPLFSVWRLAWIAHQLPRDPRNLFDANIFYPEPNTLAYSDALLLLGIVGAPLIWVGVHPVVVHNLLAIAAFVTAAAGMQRLMTCFTADRAAQIVAGIVFAFAPFRAAHLVHLELLWTAFIPLSLLALYRLLQTPTTRRAIVFGTMVALQTLCSVYYGLFLVIFLAPAMLLAPLHLRFRWSRRHGAALVLSVLTTAVLVSAYAGPYSNVRAAVGPRSENEVQAFSAQFGDYLRASPLNRLYGAPPRGDDDERSLSAGVAATLLAVVSVTLVRTRITAAFALLTALAVDLSRGTNGVLFTSLRDVLPLLEGIRAPARFAVFVLLGVSVLASLAVAHLTTHWTAARRRVFVSVVAALLMVEYWIAPVPTFQPPLVARGVDAWLAMQPRTVVASLPMPPPSGLWGHEASFQYLSIFHWQPTVNGYSGYAPRTYLRRAEQVQDFPSDAAVAGLRAEGVELVVLREKYAAAGEFDRLLYGCQNRRWFSEVLPFEEVGSGRSAACRLQPRGSESAVPP